VLWELLTWQLPFGPANPWHLVAHVLAGGRLDVPPIDALPGPDTAAFGGGGLEGYLALMQRCWAQVSEQRPGFQQVVRELRWAVPYTCMGFLGYGTPLYMERSVGRLGGSCTLRRRSKGGQPFGCC